MKPRGAARQCRYRSGRGDSTNKAANGVSHIVGAILQTVVLMGFQQPRPAVEVNCKAPLLGALPLPLEIQLIEAKRRHQGLDGGLSHRGSRRGKLREQIEVQGVGERGGGGRGKGGGVGHRGGGTSLPVTLFVQKLSFLSSFHGIEINISSTIIVMDININIGRGGGGGRVIRRGKSLLCDAFLFFEDINTRRRVRGNSLLANRHSPLFCYCLCYQKDHKKEGR